MASESSSDDDDVPDMRKQAHDDDDEESEEDDKRKKKGGKADNDEEDDDDEEEEEEEEDDDDDDEEEDDVRRKKKRGRKDGSKYVDMEAGEGESDDEEETRHKKKSRDNRDYDDDDDAEMSEEQQQSMLHQWDQHRNRGPAFLHDDDVGAHTFKDRYRSIDEEEEDEMDENIQNARLPDATKDPKVWCVKVANGTEHSMLQKFVSCAQQGRPINVTSVYCNEQALGYIYVEATKIAYVREILTGMRGVYSSKLKMVPNKEMVDTLTVLKKTAAAMATGWARVKRGKYKGDIAQVLSVDHNKNEVEVRLVPRVDTTDYSQFDENEAKKRKAKAIPTSRLFDPNSYKSEDLEKWGIEEARDEHLDNCFMYEGMKFKEAFLIKSFPVRSLILGPDVQPELDELQIFEKGQDEKARDDTVGRAMGHLTSIHKRKVVLQKGDVVRVVSGELKDLIGDVDSTVGNAVIVKVRHEQIKEHVEFPLDELEKYFDQGDHVKVVGGRRIGTTGTVVRLEGEIVYIDTDVSHEEVRVFSSDLQDTNEVSNGLDVVGVYKLYDLVQLESAGVSMTMPSVGVIIKLQKDTLQVIDNNNKIKAVRPSDVQLQKKSATAVALDSEQQMVGQGDMVRVTEGPFKGKTGTVRHLFRAFLFLYSTARMESAGVFCVRSRQCVLMGQSKHTENTAPNMGFGGGMIPGRGAPGRGGGMVPHGPGGRGGGAVGRGRGAMWEGKRVRIIRGFDRNKVGTVKEETETVCRVELDATHKRVTVKKDEIVELGKTVTPSRQNTHDSHSNHQFSHAGSMTPAWTPSTPGFDGSQTPMHESASTPGTPRHSYFDQPSPAPEADHTPYTPATPGNYVGSSPYEQPAQTPATPAAYGYGYGGYSSTPGGVGATPGDVNSPHTPMTPGGGGGWSNNQAGFLSGPGNTYTPYDPSPSTPATPGGEGLAARPAPQTKNWCIENIEVRVVSGEFIDCVGVVVELQGSDCVVRLVDGKVTTVPAEDLEGMPPQKNMNVIILGGELQGSTGKLIGIDGRDGIVKMDLNSDIKIVDMPLLAIHVPLRT